LISFDVLQVAKIAKKVSDAPCGGQIVMSGDTLAQVRSMQDLMQRVHAPPSSLRRVDPRLPTIQKKMILSAHCLVFFSEVPLISRRCGLLTLDYCRRLFIQVAMMCAGWRHGEAAADPHTPAAMAVMSLGSHLLSDIPQLENHIIEATPDIAAADEPSTTTEVISTADPATPECPNDLGLVRLTADKRPTLTAVGVPKMDQSCILPPSIGGENFIDDLYAAVGDGSSTDSSNEDEDSAREVIIEERNPLKAHPSMIDRTALNNVSRDVVEAQQKAAAELRESHELIMVLPWPLKSRGAYYPPVSTVKALTPAWDAAPSASGVTILFAFLEGGNKLKELEPKQAASEALWQLQAVVSAVKLSLPRTKVI
jgi:hypothetical protein